MSASAGLHRQVDGASAVEFALIAPVLIVFLFGIFAVGWAFHCVSSLQLALEQSGRALQIDPTLSQSQLNTMVKNRLADLGDPNVSVALSTGSINGVTTATISGTYLFQITIPLLPAYSIDYQTAVNVPLPG